MTTSMLFRLSAFTTVATEGNPAGVWVGDAFPDAAVMQRIATDVGFSETAFVVPMRGTARQVRYFSPEAEVPFCGHATIATGVLLGARDGDATYNLSTKAGEVPVVVRTRDGQREASLTSVSPRHEPAPERLVTDVLATLGWNVADLEPAIPPARVYAGAWHLVLALRSRQQLDAMTYKFETLKHIMLRDGLTTLQLIWRETPLRYHARDPFPVGGVVEDPATGAAAAALGGYLRDAGLLDTPGKIVIQQGEAMGRPSQIFVDIPAEGGIIVTGAAVELPP